MAQTRIRHYGVDINLGQETFLLQFHECMNRKCSVLDLMIFFRIISFHLMISAAWHYTIIVIIRWRYICGLNRVLLQVTSVLRQNVPVNGGDVQIARCEIESGRRNLLFMCE